MDGSAVFLGSKVGKGASSAEAGGKVEGEGGLDRARVARQEGAIPGGGAGGRKPGDGNRHDLRGRLEGHGERSKGMVWRRAGRPRRHGFAARKGVLQLRREVPFFP